MPSSASSLKDSFGRKLFSRYHIFGYRQLALNTGVFQNPTQVGSQVFVWNLADMLNLTKLEGFDAKVAILSKYASEWLRRPGETGIVVSL